MVDVGKVDGIAMDDIGKINLMAVPSAGAAFTDYHYYEDLAGAASYTPTANTFATLFVESGQLNDDYEHVEFYDGAGWVAAHGGTTYEPSCMIYQDTAQSIRVTNGGTLGNRKISLTGVVWTGLADFKYYADLAGAATYTPTAQTLATLFNEALILNSDWIHPEFYDGSGWINGVGSTTFQASTPLYQDNAQSLRIHNGAGSARKIILTGGTWS